MTRSSALRHESHASWSGPHAAPGASGLYANAFRVAWNYAEEITATKDKVMGAHGHFHWNELLTADPERAKKFYQQTIGWRFEPMPLADDPNATYWVAYLGETPVAGIFPTNRPAYAGVPEGWMPYLAVDDVDARVKKAVDAGARLMRPLFDIPNIGRIAILTEPGGAGIGWITPFCESESKAA